MPTVTVNGIELYYERAGTGPHLLVVNGSGATLRTSAPLIEVFTRRFDVVAHDQRGLGRTQVVEGPYSMGDYAADALGLLDAVGWPSCRVVGVSFGGMVAQELAVTAPERVERLALLCTSPGGEGGSSFPLHKLTAMDPAQRAAISRQLLDARFTPDWLDEHPEDRALTELMARRSPEDEPEIVRYGMAMQLEARRHHDAWDRLERITCPTFVGAGRFDGIAPLCNAEAMAGRIRGASLHVYEGGHAFFVQDARALPDVLGFLES
ncbi:MAG TPA: alpha/beta hydrolase [Acidimicrobiales bacterium]|nr:alpha/beta hydrolase [Acidimicrobiales bacterium]